MNASTLKTISRLASAADAAIADVARLTDLAHSQAGAALYAGKPLESVYFTARCQWDLVRNAQDKADACVAALDRAMLDTGILSDADTIRAAIDNAEKRASARLVGDSAYMIARTLAAAGEYRADTAEKMPGAYRRKSCRAQVTRVHARYVRGKLMIDCARYEYFV